MSSPQSGKAERGLEQGRRMQTGLVPLRRCSKPRARSMTMGAVFSNRRFSLIIREIHTLFVKLFRMEGASGLQIL